MSDHEMPSSQRSESDISLVRLSYAYRRLDAVVWKLVDALGELNVPPEVWSEIRAARHIAHPEPALVLRGGDALAPAVVRRWAELAMLSGAPRDKVDNALSVAQSMEEWQIRNLPIEDFVRTLHDNSGANDQKAPVPAPLPSA